MKTWVKVALGIAAFIAIIIAGAFYFTAGVTRTGDDFFAAVRAGDMQKARSALSTAFRESTSETELAAYLSANGMDKVTDTSWSSRSVSGGRGSLTGTLSTADEKSIPVEIVLISEQDSWKIQAIRNTAGPVGVGYGPIGLPEEKLQLALIAESTGVFADAIEAGDMTGFHNHISYLWAQQFDVAKLNEVYAPLFKTGSRMQAIKSVAPIYEAPAALSDQGIMEIKFYYPVDAVRIHYGLKYIVEGTGWKVMGLTVQVK